MFGFMLMFVLYSYTMGKAHHGEGHSHDGKPELATPLARPLILGMPSLWGFMSKHKMDKHEH
jgi:hypothetical protein